jgi:hypothetical protein
MRVLEPGGRGWLLAIFVSRVGASMISIAYAARLPWIWGGGNGAAGIRRDPRLVRAYEPWRVGWAFVSLVVAGLVAVASGVLLHRTPEASVLHRGAAMRVPAVSAPAR